MESLTAKQLGDLLLTKAMADSVGSIERWGSLNDVIDEVFADGAIDREDYLHSVMELTQLGFINSDIQTEEDIELSEAVGYDIQGLTVDGLDYIKQLKDKPEFKERVTSFFNQFSKVCGAVSDNGTVKLLGSTILPLLALFV